MKHTIFFIAILITSFVTKAQVNTNLILNARPPANLSQWSITAGTVTLIVTNQQAPRRAKIKVTITTTAGDAVASTDLTQAAVFQFNDGNTVLNAASVFPLQIQRFVGKYQNTINRTGKLPSDNYQFCVELIEVASAATIAPAQCRTFLAASMQLPFLIMPYQSQQLKSDKANTVITFRWTPISPRPQTKINYRLQVFEVLQNQQPLQALRSNQPLLDKIIPDQTQFIWQPQGILNCCNSDSTNIMGKAFIWTIQSNDAAGVPLGIADSNGEARSEPVIFYIKK